MSPPARKIASSLALVLAFAALSTSAPIATATPDYEVDIMDDQLLLGKSDQEVATRMTEFARLGVDRVKVSAFWRNIAPNPTSRIRPNFTPTDPGSPRYKWSELDRVVRFARATGLKVMLEITGPFPLWASENPGRRNHLWRPRVKYYGDFAQAVSKRYADSVDRYGIWNEPNQGAWLQPQSTCSRRGCRVVAPRIYRQLAQAAYPAIKSGDPTSEVLVGELAPSGAADPGPTRPLRPLTFLRFMSCRTARYTRIRGGTCRTFAPITADGIGHHPYSVLPFLGPRSRSPSPDDAALGDTRRFLRVVDRLQALGGLVRPGGGKFPVYYTEFGYQTNPPDPFSGVSLRTQSRRLQESAYRVSLMPRVRSLNQFRLTDGPILNVAGPRRYLEFQSGLAFANGRAKPSYRSFPDPFRVNKRVARRGSTVVFWGQVRPGGAHRVTIQRNLGAGYNDLARVQTDPNGIFTFRFRPQGTGRYRFAYGDSAARGFSDAIRVGVR
jgi:Cellulase (glycosyl hydrolase family 5)